MTKTSPLVLIADDEAPLRRVLQRALEREGYRVLAAGTAEAAYELLASEGPDAVLLDVRLPTMSGLALYLAIVHRWPALLGRVAIMTGDAEGDEVRPWLERNPCTVIRKPFELKEVFAWLRLVTQAPTRERANGFPGELGVRHRRFGPRLLWPGRRNHPAGGAGSTRGGPGGRAGGSD